MSAKAKKIKKKKTKKKRMQNTLQKWTEQHGPDQNQIVSVALKWNIHRAP